MSKHEKPPVTHDVSSEDGQTGAEMDPRDKIDAASLDVVAAWDSPAQDPRDRSLRLLRLGEAVGQLRDALIAAGKLHNNE